MPEIGGTAPEQHVHRPGPAEVAAFAAAVNEALGPDVNHSIDPASGHQWTWVHHGLWTLTVGGILTPEPHLQGPPGRWRLATAAIGQADLVVLMVQLAGGLPAGVDRRRPRADAAVARVTTPAAAEFRPDEPAWAHGQHGQPVLLRPHGAPRGTVQRVVTPSGQDALINLDGETRFAEPLPDGRIGAVVVAAPAADRDPEAPIEGRLFEPPAAGYAPWKAAPGAAVLDRRVPGTGPAPAVVPVSDITLVQRRGRLSVVQRPGADPAG